MKSKYSEYADRIISIHKESPELSISKIALIISNDIDLPLDNKGTPNRALRFYIKFLLEGLDVPSEVRVITDSDSDPNDYSNKGPEKLVLSAWSDDDTMMDIDEYCKKYRLPRKDITSYKLVSHTGTPYYNIVFKENIEYQEDLTEQYILSSIERVCKPRERYLSPTLSSSIYMLRIVITDAHIAMETNKNGYGLYGGVWNEVELGKRGDKIIESILEAGQLYGSFDEIHIIDLGDYLDGWDGHTVRKGHDLPQNMDNEKAFDVGLDWKIQLIDRIIDLQLTYKIRVHNICNDNHAGAFGYVVNSGIKRALEIRYGDVVRVFNHRRFMNHYYYGNHCFILCHGKDAHALKFGFKPVLDKKGKEKIDEYIDINNLGGKFVTFEKGDSHQQLFDCSSSDRFDYNNYMALSPSSEWVQTNFKRGSSGFNRQIVIATEKGIDNKPYYFNWKVSK